MKLIRLTILILFINGCTYIGSDKTYWCGDHACLNKDEREEYFKKTMIVEIRDIDTNSDKKSIKNRKKLLKEAKLEKSKRIKEEKKIKLKKKKLEKKARLDEKKKLIEEKKLQKEVKKRQEKEYLKKIKKEKANTDKVNKNDENILSKKANKKKEVEISSFYKLVEAIMEKNSLKPFPDINDIPE